MTKTDLLAIPGVPPSRSVSYGDHGDQVMDIYLPEPSRGGSAGPWPVALLLHGGCWRSQVTRTYFGQFARALAEHGIASCNVEYRRLGSGGGLRETFEDVAAAAEAVGAMAGTPAEPGVEEGVEPNTRTAVPLDLDRVIAVGHSAGGHLALWLAARGHLPASAPGATERPLAIRGVLALAGIPDLAAAHAQGICDGAVAELLGGDPHEAQNALAWSSPAELPPTPAPHVHLVGELDTVVPPAYLEDCVARMRSRGQDTRLKTLPGSGHMEPVVAGAPPWADVLAAIQHLLGGTMHTERTDAPMRRG